MADSPDEVRFMMSQDVYTLLGCADSPDEVRFMMSKDVYTLLGCG